jgi:hypothetical protein
VYGMRLRPVSVLVTAIVVVLAVVGLSTLATARESGPTKWPVNASGRTYGSGLDAVSPADEPDLIKVEATNGLVGYSLRTDLEDPDPSSPSEAVRIQTARGGAPREIPVYQVDGKTKIGAFVVEYPEPKLR